VNLTPSTDITTYLTDTLLPIVLTVLEQGCTNHLLAQLVCIC